jgi:hypothetical protein
MPIRFQCPACGAVIEALDHQAGARGECPPCGQRLQVPSTTQESGPYARKGIPIWGWVAGGTCLFLVLIVVCGAPRALWQARPLDRGQLTLRQFITQQPKSPVTVEAECTLDTHYSYGYRHAKKTHYSVSLRTDEKTYGHGYLFRSSAAGERLYELLKDGRRRVLVLEVQRIDPYGEVTGDPHEFAILRFAE